MSRLDSHVNRTGVSITLLIAALAGTALAAAAPESRPSTRAARDRVDDEQFQRDMLGESSASDAGSKARELMGESARRLVARDPGEGTQYVQEQIVQEIDRLIDELDRRPAPPPPRKTPTRPVDGKDEAPAPPVRADTPRGNRGGSTQPDPKEDPRPSPDAWGRISPRLRGPVVEGRSERVIAKYKSLVDDYYRAVAAKATKKD
jgi:hypothetical protein